MIERQDIKTAIDMLDQVYTDGDNQHIPPHIISVLMTCGNEITSLGNKLETERLRLAACGVAAFGYFTDYKDTYISESLNDVLSLQKQLEATRLKLVTAHGENEELSRQLAEAKVDAEKYFRAGLMWGSGKFALQPCERFTGNDVAMFLIMESAEVDSNDIATAMEEQRC